MSNEARFIRAFVSLPIPEGVKDEIERVQEDLRRWLPARSPRWTKRDQFHLTLKFLGNVETGRVPELIQALRYICAGIPALKLRAERVGGFPGLRHPRVLWVGVQEEAGQLVELQSRIEAGCAEFSEEARDRKFTGHVTIARIHEMKRPQPESWAARLRDMTEKQFGQWTAREVRLIRSELTPSGAVHSILEVFPLV
jgi:2'-5' RNA ligase